MSVLLASLLFFSLHYIKCLSLGLGKIRKCKIPIKCSLQYKHIYITIMNKHAVSVADKLGHRMASEMSVSKVKLLHVERRS